MFSVISNIICSLHVIFLSGAFILSQSLSYLFYCAKHKHNRTCWQKHTRSLGIFFPVSQVSCVSTSCIKWICFVYMWFPPLVKTVREEGDITSMEPIKTRDIRKICEKKTEREWQKQIFSAIIHPSWHETSKPMTQSLCWIVLLTTKFTRNCKALWY